MWSKKKPVVTEKSLNQELLNDLHLFIVKYRSIGNNNTANQLVDIYTTLNKSFSNVEEIVKKVENSEVPKETNANASPST